MSKFWKVVIVIIVLGATAVWLVWDLPAPEAVIEEIIYKENENSISQTEWMGR